MSNDTQPGPWIQLVGRLQSLHRKSGFERSILAIAFVLFLALFYVSYRSLPDLTVHWRWLGIVGAAALAVLPVAGLEYQIAGRALGHRIGLGEALRVSILSSAANLLPIPGAVLVRTEALRRKGSRYVQALQSTAAIGAAWVGTAAMLAGTLVAVQQRFLGAVFLLGGVAALAVMMVLLKRSAEAVWVSATQIVAVELLFVLLSALRLYATLRGIGLGATPTQAIALVVAAALAAAVGIFPGGLGLREIIAGALSPLVGFPVAAGILGTAIDRLIGLLLLAIAAGVLLVAPSGSHRLDHERGDRSG